jgi:hypothetical protein
MGQDLLEYLLKKRKEQRTKAEKICDRLASYYEAIETGTTERHWDSRDVQKGKMKVEDYNRKWHAHRRASG